MIEVAILTIIFVCFYATDDCDKCVPENDVPLRRSPRLLQKRNKNPTIN